MEGLKTIGRKEKAQFPALNLKEVSVKVDTGAYTSSIHCSSIIRESDERVKCIFLDASEQGYTGEELSFDIVKELKVKSSNGDAEQRIMIQTNIELLGDVYPILLTLTDRSDMRTPALIGRRFLSRKFVVDVTRKNQ